MSAIFMPSPVAHLRSRLFSGSDKAPLLSPGLVAAADQAVEKMAGLFLEWVGENIGRLRAQALEAETPGADLPVTLKSLKMHAFEIAGLGGTFGYPLLTVVGTSLVDLLSGRKSATPLLLSTIRVHVDALTLVYNERLRGDGGRDGEELVASLKKAVGRIHAEDARAAAIGGPASDAA